MQNSFKPQRGKFTLELFDRPLDQVKLFQTPTG